ncbi:hypothetical protein K457DRAFT_123187 [Linnemannia elongata AG-77]|uniref:CCHC-type domain-containing protein n=1 Tax=Linnemannia elongata AG-77 TaxID=1314771 RepID=A0A197K4X8_9FUNG|nr:hypothetical protein K457DRAFT_123187 [Linnemannia elongata AG-77]
MIRHQILFRALRNEEDPSAVIRPTDPMANLTFKDHVERGGFRIYRPSQFISTTSNLERAIRWFRFKCDFCRRRGHNIKYNHYCREYYEHTSVVLARQPYNTRIAANRWQQLNDRNYTYHSPRGNGDNNCNEQEIEFYLEQCNDRYCHQCNEYGHDDDDCNEQQFEFYLEQCNDRYCHQCNEYGHDDDDCNEQHYEFYLEQYNDRYCHQCYEYGHDDDDCNEFSDWL